MLRVLHVIPSVGPARGGPSEVARILAPSLAAAGAAVTVATTDDNGAGRLTLAAEEGVDEHGVSWRQFRRQARFYTLSLPLGRWLSAHVADYDVVHLHALFSYAPGCAGRAAARAGVPYLVRPLGTLSPYGLARRRLLKRASMALVEQPLLRGAAAVHWTSTQERAEAPAFARARPGVVIPNPVARPASDTAGSFLANHGELAGRRLVLFLSRIDPKKGLDVLLEAQALLRARQPDAVLVVAGDGAPNLVERLRRDAARLRLDQGVTWVGRLSGPAKWQALAAADVMVLPSRSENFALAVAEAMAVGTPVVVSAGVGLAPEIAQWGAGLVVPVDAAKVADAVAEVLGNPGAATAMGEAGRRLAATQFAPDRVAAALLDLYHSLIEAGRRTGPETK